MPANKKQHYIPQFYQHFFSSDGKTVGLYIIKNANIIDKAQIRNTASKDYMYSKPDSLNGDGMQMEHTLSTLEELISETFKNVIKNPQAQISSKDRFWLLLSVLLQQSRTNLNSENLKSSVSASLDAYFEVLNNTNSEIKEIINQIWSRQAPISIDTAMSLLAEGIDLDIKIIVNKTRIPFVISDNPVCVWNLWYEKNKIESIGLCSRGLLMFMPITPFIGVFMMDDEVYDFRGQSNDCVNVVLEEDVHQLNKLIYHYADEIILFKNDSINAKDLVALFRDEKHIDIKDRVVKDRYYCQEREFVYSYEQYPTNDKHLSFIYLKQNWESRALDDNCFFRCEQKDMHPFLIGCREYYYMRRDPSYISILNTDSTIIDYNFPQ